MTIGNFKMTIPNNSIIQYLIKKYDSSGMHKIMHKEKKFYSSEIYDNKWFNHIKENTLRSWNSFLFDTLFKTISLFFDNMYLIIEYNLAYSHMLCICWVFSSFWWKLSLLNKMNNWLFKKICFSLMSKNEFDLNTKTR